MTVISPRERDRPGDSAPLPALRRPDGTARPCAGCGVGTGAVLGVQPVRAALLDDLRLSGRQGGRRGEGTGCEGRGRVNGETRHTGHATSSRGGRTEADRSSARGRIDLARGRDDGGWLPGPGTSVLSRASPSSPPGNHRRAAPLFRPDTAVVGRAGTVPPPVPGRGRLGRGGTRRRRGRGGRRGRGRGRLGGRTIRRARVERDKPDRVRVAFTGECAWCAFVDLS
jgi:hypothetical protein